MSVPQPGTKPFEITDVLVEIAAQTGLPSGGTLSPAALPKLLTAVGGALRAERSFLVRTSGSTGGPKRVLLSAAALRASAEVTNETLGGAGQWLLALQPQVIAGLQVLVRSVLGETQPVLLAGRFEAEAFVTAAQQLTASRRYTSVVPVQLARLLDLAERSPAAQQVLARFDAILVGGQAVPAADVERAQALHLAVVRTYGGTETAGGCAYDGVPIGDTRIRIVDGEIWLGGSCLADGYLGDAALTTERFSTDEQGRWFHTRDAGSVENGMLTVTGRIDRVFISGGVNVSLDAIERVLAELRGWQQAVAISVVDAQWGHRAVLVRAQADAASGLSFVEVQETLRTALGSAAVPVRLVELAELPLLASGKPDLSALEKNL